LNFLCSSTCATETRPAHPRSCLPNSPCYNRRLRFAAFLSSSPRYNILPPLQGPRSVRIRAVPSVVFSSAASNILHTRPCCSRANPPATVALQLLPHHARPSCTSTRSWPELVQWRHHYALHAVVLHIVVLRSNFSSSCCRILRSPRSCRIASAHTRTACVLGPCYVCLHRPSSVRTLPCHGRSSACTRAIACSGHLFQCR
jgi:hypothetical protein